MGPLFDLGSDLRNVLGKNGLTMWMRDMIKGLKKTTKPKGCDRACKSPLANERARNRGKVTHHDGNANDGIGVHNIAGLGFKV